MKFICALCQHTVVGDMDATEIDGEEYCEDCAYEKEMEQ